MQDLHHALRLLRRTPGFTAVAVLVLALGIGANAAVFSVVNALALRPLPGRVGELVGIFNADRTRPDSYRSFSYPAYLDIRDNNGAFNNVLAQMPSLVGVGEGDAIRRQFVLVVSSNYFTTVGVSLAAGRAFSPAEERPGAAILAAVASYDTWRLHGFDPQFVGSTVKVNGLDFTVVGVAPKGFTGTILAGPEWWFPIGAYDQIVSDLFAEGGGGLATRGRSALILAGLLKPGLTMADAQARLDPLARRLAEAYPDSDRERVFTVAALPRFGLSTSPQSGDQVLVVSGLLLAMSALVLVVACLNLANLMLARGNARRKEIALRLALGGGRSRIVRQLMIEALVLSACGAAAGIAMAWWATAVLGRSFASVLPISMIVDVTPDLRVMAVTAVCAVASTVFFALGPAWSLSRTDLVSDMKLDARAPSASRSRVTRLLSGPALVMGQLAVSLALVAAGGLFVRGAMTVATIDAGFPFDRQLVVGIDPSLAGLDEVRGREFYRAALERLRGLAGVEGASLASSVPFGEISEERSVRLPGATEAVAEPVFRIVGAGYFKTLGLGMVGGHEFAAEDDIAGPRASRVTIVNEPLAQRLFGRESPVGRQVQVRTRSNDPYRTFEIIGVAPGLRHDLSDRAPVPHIYMALGGEYRAGMTLHLRVADEAMSAPMLGAVARELKALNAAVPTLSLRTMAAHRDTSILAWAVRAAAGLFGAFGALALLLATIGVYGLQAYDVSRRTREIGIRVALGARRTDVARMVLADAGRTAAWGLGIGLMMAVGLGRAASGILFGVTPFDPLVLAAAAVILTSATLLASLVPARRATRVQPLDALRSE